MKKIFTLLIGIVFSLTVLNAQEAPPQAFSYKAIIMKANGAIIANKTIGLQISILQGSTIGVPVYIETFRPTTNANGQIDIVIGQGTTGDLSSIDWSLDKYFLKTAIDEKGGKNYQPMSVTQLLSVPYALYADKAGSALSVDYNDLTNRPVGTNIGDMQYWNGTEWVMVPVGLNGQVLTLFEGVPKWGGAGEVPNQSPYLITNGISSSTPNSFTTGGYILSDGGTPVNQRGVCWNTTGSPTVANSITNEGGGSGGFISTVTGLIVGTTYYVRAYATNNVGTGYGNEISFATSQIRVTGITLNSSAMTLLPEETSQLTATVMPDDAYDKSVSWTSSNAAIATVSPTGVVTAVANGVTTITATTIDGAKTAVCEIRVAQYNLRGIINSNLDLGENNVVSVSGTLQIAAGVTLNIGPGTIVYGNGNEIQTWGSFVAIGNTGNKITFNNVNLASKTGGSYDLQYCIFNSGILFGNWGNEHGQINLKYNEISNLTTGIWICYPTSGCLIEGNIFRNCYGFYIYLNNYNINVTFKNNRFEQMTSCSIELVANYGAPENLVVLGNSFMDTGQVQIKITVGGGGKDINAINNYWHTVDPSVISSMIYDRNDDLNSPGIVSYTPFLTSPDPLTP